MVTFDIAELLKSLERAHADAVDRLEHMVREFAYEFSIRAVENTPLGDAQKNAKWYTARTDLPQIEGLARGNWQFSTDGEFNLQMIAGQSSGDAATDGVMSQSARYVLGSTFYLGNAAPYILDLENDYSPQTSGNGITKPTLDDITGVYAVDFQRHYNYR